MIMEIYVWGVMITALVMYVVVLTSSADGPSMIFGLIIGLPVVSLIWPYFWIEMLVFYLESRPKKDEMEGAN